MREGPTVTRVPDHEMKKKRSIEEMIDVMKKGEQRGRLGVVFD